MLKRLLSGAFGVVLMAGCTGPEGPEQLVAAQPEVVTAVSTAAVGAAGGRVAVPGGPTVEIPPGSVSGNGRLLVRKAEAGHDAPASSSPFLAVRDAYEFALEGARLTGPVQVTFPVLMQPLPAQADEDAAAMLAHYDREGKSWNVVPARYDPDRNLITAEVYDLSWWNALVWDFSALRNAVAVNYRSALEVTAREPYCQQEVGARQGGVQVSSAESDRVLWCYGLDEGRPVLKVVNMHGHPVTIDYPRAWRARPRQVGVRLPRGINAVLEPATKTKTLLLSGGSAVDIYPSVLSPSGTVTANSSGAGFLAMALALGLDTFGAASGGVPGAPKAAPDTSAEVLAEVLDSGCLDRFARRLNLPVENLDAAETRKLEAHSAAFGCLQKAWQKQNRPGGRAGDFTGVALTWLASGIDVLLDGVTGVADAAVYSTPQTIRVQAVEPSPQMIGLGNR